MDKFNEGKEWLQIWPSFADVSVCAMIFFLIFSIFLISLLPQEIRIGELADDKIALFKSGEADLGEEYKQKIDEIYNDIISKPEWKNDDSWVVVVKGHTDNKPIKNAKYKSNWDLSAARALSVVDYLIQKGIPQKRIRAIGYGEHDPKIHHKTPTPEPRNRRIEVILFKSDGRL
jgi:flagellar motor protein MotB